MELVFRFIEGVPEKGICSGGTPRPPVGLLGEPGRAGAPAYELAALRQKKTETVGPW